MEEGVCAALSPGNVREASLGSDSMTLGSAGQAQMAGLTYAVALP